MPLSVGAQTIGGRAISALIQIRGISDMAIVASAPHHPDFTRAHRFERGKAVP
jgi:hypothetical protein